MDIFAFAFFFRARHKSWNFLGNNIYIASNRDIAVGFVSLCTTRALGSWEEVLRTSVVRTVGAPGKKMKH